jgi:2'-5' RNA ligase
MKNINSIPGYKVNEYLLVLNPHEELRNKIMNVKKQFFETYKNESAVYGKPQITLVNFVQYHMQEERLVNRLNTIAMGFHPIKVDFKYYGSFPAHTI